MGIKNFNKLLEEYAPNSKIEKSITDYKGKSFAIDTSLILYQYISALRNSGKDLDDNKGNSTSHIFAIIQNVFYFLDKGIKPVYIFDGKAPDLKKITLEKRKKNKQNAEEKQKQAKSKEEEIKFFKRSLFITSTQYNEVKEILDLIGIPYIQAEGEADCLCSYLVKTNNIDFAYSSDMDFLSFGCTKLIKKNKANKVFEFNLNQLLEELDISYESFVNLTILLGCDYAPTIKGIGFKTAIKLIKEHKNIKNILEKNNKYIEPTNYKYNEIIKYYTKSCKLSNKLLIEFKKSKIKELKIKLIKNNFSESIINKYIKKLNKIQSCSSYSSSSSISVK